MLVEDGVLRERVMLLLFEWVGCGIAEASGSGNQELVFQARNSRSKGKSCCVWLDRGLAMLKEKKLEC